MLQLFNQLIGLGTSFVDSQNVRTRESLDSHRAATVQGYEDWKAAKEKAESDYQIKGLQQNVTIIILVLFVLFLVYLIFRKK